MSAREISAEEAFERLGLSGEGGPDASGVAAGALRDAFLRWQCRVRQIDMREGGGRPGSGATPRLTLDGENEPMGAIVTVLAKQDAFSKTPELRHMAQRTLDPAQRREKALQYFSETYYQKAKEFSDVLAASFAPGSAGAARILAAGRCRLAFEAFSQGFELVCDVRALAPGEPLREATWWHNALFNPGLPAEATILAFHPDWRESKAKTGS